jgi:ketopantoate reductase
LILGVYRHEDFTTTENSPAEATLLKDISDILEAGGSTVSVVPEIQRHKFHKNILNLAFSSIATLTRCVFYESIVHLAHAGRVKTDIAFLPSSVPLHQIRRSSMCLMCAMLRRI